MSHWILLKTYEDSHWILRRFTLNLIEYLGSISASLIYCKSLRRIGICSFFFFLLFLFMATPAAYGRSQARDRIGAAGAGLFHSNAGFELHLWHVAAYSSANPEPTDRGQGSNPYPHKDIVRFLTCSATTGTPILVL